jgi:hypothetical protein
MLGGSAILPERRGVLVRLPTVDECLNIPVLDTPVSVYHTAQSGRFRPRWDSRVHRVPVSLSHAGPQAPDPHRLHLSGQYYSS